MRGMNKLDLDFYTYLQQNWIKIMKKIFTLSKHDVGGVCESVDDTVVVDTVLTERFSVLGLKLSNPWVGSLHVSSITRGVIYCLIE